MFHRMTSLFVQKSFRIYFRTKNDVTLYHNTEGQSFFIQKNFKIYFRIFLLIFAAKNCERNVCQHYLSKNIVNYFKDFVSCYA